jgi:hypothetical protein
VLETRRLRTDLASNFFEVPTCGLLSLMIFGPKRFDENGGDFLQDNFFRPSRVFRGRCEAHGTAFPYANSTEVIYKR